MRTTMDIDDVLLRAAEAHAAAERESLKATVEQALREPRRTASDAPPIPEFRGRCVQPGVDLTDNATLEAIMKAASRRQPGTAANG